MRFSVVSFVAVFAMIAGPALAKPSSTPYTGYVCPEYDSQGHGQVSGKCDSPPFSGDYFGCTFYNGKGTGSNACTYHKTTGQCTSSNSYCPSTASYTSTKKKRSPVAAPATPGGVLYNKRDYKNRAAL
ncbi:uncharacterized protein BT62DRAFT_931183 [Guyanagaster necrorhizus]|uniref:Uncharacterized protein n=1 Tax=Guyanagaster necrorhizus TaxID=856835 RepID=A0A9P7VTT8_9AGAR|nr:uncharacterized protein BT62DRAFT_931183 [Guyanagaster necrorhizus MCA 3950]KAG7447346.1 hypothetical protein BT62DRAFT_931183 [Guyanagaster necrorhizus MCA 3950]